MPPGVPGQAPRWNDPAAFAATSPPPTGEEHEAARRAQSAPPPAPPPAAHEPSAPQDAVDPEHVAPDAPRVLAAFLVSYDADDLGQFWPLFQGQNVIGRKGAMDGLSIEIDHPTTSSRHAVILASARPGRVKLEDPGSTNGTFINEQRVENARQYELKDGDRVRFGGFATVVKIV